MQDYILKFKEQQINPTGGRVLLQDFIEILKANFHIFLYKTPVLITHEFLISWFNADDVFIIKYSSLYYYIILNKIKITYNMFTLQEILNIADQAKSSEILYYESNASNFYWTKKFFFKQIQNAAIFSTCIHNQPSSPKNLISLDLADLYAIIAYFEPTALTYTKISPACSRLYLENCSPNPEQLFNKLANKTIFIVHKKNNEYYRTGPFIFKNINYFFEKLFTFDSAAELNSDSSGTIKTIAYIDVYSCC